MLSLQASALIGFISFLGLATNVLADCECGYSVNATNQPHAVFTELLESDFTMLENITLDTDWVPQEWKVDKAASHGPFGRSTELKNVVSNPAKNGSNSVGIDGGVPGLNLFVRATPSDATFVSVSEVDTNRTDMLYGSFRAAMQTTQINGTVAAFFWYFNDTQEIDMEFLSAEMNDTSSPVNLVLHSTLSLENGNDASSTPTFKVFPLPFQPTNDIHEYRFDWQPGSVSFYADGKWLIDMTETEFVPTTPGKIILSHWSNGNPLWSAGPPTQDAKMTVSYVKAYFNSSEEDRQKDYSTRCKDISAPNAICQIPDQVGQPQFGQFNLFSTDPSGNKTVNQTVYSNTKKSTAMSKMAPSQIIVIVLVTFVCVLAL